MKQMLDCADIFIAAPCCLGYLWAADKFCKRHLGTSKEKELLFMFFSFCGYLALDIVSRRYAVPYIFSVMGMQILFLGMVLLFFRESQEKKILAASILMIIMTSAESFWEAVLSCLTLFFHYTVQKIPNPILNKWEDGVIGCVGICLAIASVCFLTKRLGSVFWGKPGKWYAILAVPLLTLIAVSDVAGWGASKGIMIRSGGSMGLYYDQIFSHIGFAVLAAISMSAAGVYVFGMNRIYLEQEKNSRYHSQIAVYKMLAEQRRQSERLRHDMKNHIIALSALCRNKEWEKLGNYLKNMEGICLDAGGDLTGNKTVDALLYQKQKRAEEENIKWECDVQIPKDCCIEEFDLCVLFGNILDNALEACERMSHGEFRFISIQAKTVKKCFLLEVKNSMDMAEKYEGRFTNKVNPQEHGIGLINVGDVVHRYNGAVNMETEKGSFTISVLMPFHNTVRDMKTIL